MKTKEIMFCCWSYPVMFIMVVIDIVLLKVPVAIHEYFIDIAHTISDKGRKYKINKKVKNDS